jgi:ABC-type branched-subunit amino acid transport system substrate-binding protein
MNARACICCLSPNPLRAVILALGLSFGALGLSFGALAAAEEATGPDVILIGQTAGFTGQVAGQVKEMTAAAKAYFEYVNKRGGVHGRRIVLKSLDDGYDAKRAAANAKKLIVEDNVFALALSRGTPPSEAIVPVLNEYKVPLVGPATGSQSLHEPFSRYLFNIRAKYRAEAVRIIDHLAGVHVSRIAVLHQSNSFGLDGLAGFQEGLANNKLAAVAVVAFDPAKAETGVTVAVDRISAAKPDAVVIAGPLKPTAEFIQLMKKRGDPVQFLVLSNLSSDSFIAELGDAAPGVIVTQIVPYPWNTAMPLAKELQTAIRESPESAATVSYTAMEGLVYAKVVVEGLRRAGRNPTREGFIQALEGFRGHDLGGLAVSYGPRDRSGSTYIDITIIGKDKAFHR